MNSDSQTSPISSVSTYSGLGSETTLASIPPPKDAIGGQVDVSTPRNPLHSPSSNRSQPVGTPAISRELPNWMSWGAELSSLRGITNYNFAFENKRFTDLHQGPVRPPTSSSAKPKKRLKKRLKKPKIVTASDTV